MINIPGYKIEHPIGHGGMATVYFAVQETLNRSVVLKILEPDKQNISEAAIERFISEGRIVASLSHPYIITIFDIGIADDSLYFSMEYISGGDLKKKMKYPMTPNTALNYIAKIGSALDVVHKRGIVHRDIKPANILFRDDNTPLITDFGIAKRKSTNLDKDLTRQGLFLGSPNYVSPEQAAGIDIDGRADIYSLGCIFYEMLSGEKPYRGTNILEIIMKHKQDPVPALKGDLQQFQPLLDKMMAKNRKERFKNVADMLKNINELYLSKLAITAHEIYGIEQAQQKNTPLLNVLLLLLMTSGGILGTLQYAKSISDNIPELDLDNVPINVDIPEEIITLTDNSSTNKISKDVMQALRWLGDKSLADYRLTHPPENNAYYYYSEILKENPTDEGAIQGLLNIADRYAILTERSLLKKDYIKARAYINIGLKFNPKQKTLIEMSKLNPDKPN